MKRSLAMTRKRGRPVALASTLAAAATIGAFGAAEAQALRHFDGHVLSTNAASHTFKIKAESGRRFRFHVNGATEFERLPGGFSGLNQGLRVEVNARHTAMGWLAKHVEKHRSGGSGSSGSGGGGSGGGPGGY